jgi:sugar phosphate isomerase/epimerase
MTNDNASHSSPLQRLAINQITTKRWSLAEAIAGYSRHGIKAIAIWRDKLAELGRRDAHRMLEDHGMRAIALSSVRIPLAPQLGRQSIADSFHDVLEDAAEIDAASLLVIAGPPAATDGVTTKQLLADRLHILRSLAPAGLKLVLEPLHPMFASTISPLNTLRDALDVCDQVEGIGVAVDVYNLWWDWELRQQIERAGPRLMAFHLSDWPPPSSGGSLFDRAMMGDGCIPIREIRAWMDQAGYRGPHEIEIFSDSNWWNRDPDEVIQACIARYQATC